MSASRPVVRLAAALAEDIATVPPTAMTVVTPRLPVLIVGYTRYGEAALVGGWRVEGDAMTVSPASRQMDARRERREQPIGKRCCRTDRAGTSSAPA